MEQVSSTIDASLRKYMHCPRCSCQRTPSADQLVQPPLPHPTTLLGAKSETALTTARGLGERHSSRSQRASCKCGGCLIGGVLALRNPHPVELYPRSPHSLPNGKIVNFSAARGISSTVTATVSPLDGPHPPKPRVLGEQVR